MEGRSSFFNYNPWASPNTSKRERITNIFKVNGKKQKNNYGLFFSLFLFHCIADGGRTIKWDAFHWILWRSIEENRVNRKRR